MHHDDSKKFLVGKQITIRGEISKFSLPNQGSFGQPYDAQVARVKTKRKKNVSFGVFKKRSRLGIYGIGPHSGGSMIACPLDQN